MNIANLINQALAWAASLLTFLQGQGINLGPIGAIIARDISEINADKANYDSGQAVIVGTFSEDSIDGYICVFTKTGPAAQLLGLAGPSSG